VAYQATAPQDGGGVGAGFVKEHLGVGEPGGVVDRPWTYSQPMPHRRRAPCTRWLTRPIRPSLAGRHPGPEPIAPQAPELGHHRGHGPRVVLGYDVTVPAMATVLEGLAPPKARQPVRRGQGLRGAISQRGSSVSHCRRLVRSFSSAEPHVDLVSRVSHTAGERRNGDPSPQAANTVARIKGDYRANLWVFVGALVVVRSGFNRLLSAAAFRCEKSHRVLRLASQPQHA
jgi:hypothetical protein